VLVYHPQAPLERREVQVGLGNWHHSEILAGLREGERVVTSLGRSEVQAGAMAVAP